LNNKLVIENKTTTRKKGSIMAIAEVTVIPIGTGSTSLSAYVAELHRVLEKQTGITFTLTSMSTIIEGPWTTCSPPFAPSMKRRSSRVPAACRRRSRSTTAATKPAPRSRSCAPFARNCNYQPLTLALF